MTVFLIVLAVIVVGGVLLLFVPRAMMAAKGAKLKGKPAPTPHKGSATRIKSGAKTILYFHTPSCHVCRDMDPVVRRVQKRFPSAFYKIDASANRQAASAYGVLGVPYVVFIEGGTVVSARAGAQREEAMVEFLSGGTASA